jgi:hypothetical protein
MGDMFESVPSADAYSLKMILHDWSDGECVEILSNIRQAATGVARVFIVEHIVPEHDVPHFSKLFDIHMMCWGTGQERSTPLLLLVLWHTTFNCLSASSRVTQPVLWQDALSG